MDPMPPHKVARCRDCPAQIVWCLTVANQRRMPVDLEPIPCAGHQQVWNVPPDAEADVHRQLGTTSGRLL